VFVNLEKVLPLAFHCCSLPKFRTQTQNKADCLTKLRIMISEASVAPKDRQQYEGLSEKGKEKRKDDKRKRSEVKQNRRRDFFD
jgi:hypothetical protein